MRSTMLSRGTGYAKAGVKPDHPCAAEVSGSVPGQLELARWNQAIEKVLNRLHHDPIDGAITLLGSYPEALVKVIRKADGCRGLRPRTTLNCGLRHELHHSNYASRIQAPRGASEQLAAAVTCTRTARTWLLRASAMAAHPRFRLQTETATRMNEAQATGSAWASSGPDRSDRSAARTLLPSNCGCESDPVPGRC